MKKTFLGSSAWRGLRKLGDAYLPGAAGLPCFTETKAADRFPLMAEEMDPRDRKDILFLLALLGMLPRPLVSVIVWIVELGPKMPARGFGMLRLLRLGLKGIVMGLYYSEPRIQEQIGFSLCTVRD